MKTKINLENFNKNEAGTVNNKYGRIESGDILKYQGKLYKIRYVENGVLILDTDKLFGNWGDEFPLDLVK